MPEPSPKPPRRSLSSRIVRFLLILLGVLVLAVVGVGLWLRGRLAASLPQLSGEVAMAGLAAPVTIERDALGVPTIRAANRLDAARALGFLHAQDRFFQMDLLRRKAAGELAALLGPPLVPADRTSRLHRFRHVAQESLAQASAADRELVTAYAAGVNAGLAALGERPFEYVLLRAKPAPWKPEDCLLVLYAMYFQLSDEDGHGEANLAALARKLPPAMLAFVAPQGTEWDAPLIGEPFPLPPIPGPEVYDLRQGAAEPAAPAKAAALAPASEPAALGLYRRFVEESGKELPGSNNFALAGSHTADGKALLANDMHLGISIPNTWYRASLVWPGTGGERRLTGVTLAGGPLLVAGSSGKIAWGFTNSYGDWTDLVDLELEPGNPDRYKTPQGWRPFDKVREVIEVQGGAPVGMEIRETIWGPLREDSGPLRAIAWTAHHPEASNFALRELEDAGTLEEAVAVAHRSGLPPQNFTVVDAAGRIGWTIIGKIPRRVGFDGRFPTSWADGSHRWDGWLPPEEVPTILDPPSGRIWTANHRTLSGDLLAKVGDGGYDLGARAHQIRDDLAPLEKATPKDLLKVQLDDRALFLTRWKDLLLQVLDAKAVAAHPQRQELKRLVESTWTGRASIDSVAYRAVRSFRNFTQELVFSGLLRLPPPQPGMPQEAYATHQFEAPLWKLVNERPAHLLDPRFKSWDELLLEAVDISITYWERLGPNLAERTWGEFNTTRIQHPFSLGLPAASRFLDMPPRQLPGDVDMPRVQGPGFGASERFVVSPGQEDKGIFHMPGGQSGHFLSPHYGDGHKAWEEGQPTPFLPGPTKETLKLVPKG